MTQSFGILPNGEKATLYKISCGNITAHVTDYGATLVRLFVPDKNGNLADIVLGYDDVNAYAKSVAYLGSTVGRNSNRIKNARFTLGGQTYQLASNENGHQLHGGPDGFSFRMWQVTEHTASSITFYLESPDLDQGFPGNAKVRVTYALEAAGIMRVTFDAVSDKDTVFNMTNHTYFNMAGHENTGRAMDQLLTIYSDCFTVADSDNVLTGELRSVDGTPLDFRTAKPVGKDLRSDYALMQGPRGYDHNFDVKNDLCAKLSDPLSGRTMRIYSACPGIQFYSGNYLNDAGKDGVFYNSYTGVALEPQFYPDSINHPEWKQPITPANVPYQSQIVYDFSEE